jgi:capsular exopolysaccharide synthesis family protein
MSRVDEALQRAIGAPDITPGAVTADHLTTLPRERPPLPRGNSAVVPPDRFSVRGMAAVRTGARRAQTAQFEALASDRRLVVSESAPRLGVEQYRRLAGTLHQLQTDRGLKTVMVTSAVPHEGKTLTVSNLALTLSESFGYRVLLIDADLRRPSLHQVFKVSNTTGLSDVLRSGRGEPAVLQLSPRLFLLPGGRPDADPLLGMSSSRMQTSLDQFAEQFDWVLLDAAPVGLVPEARLLANLTRAVLFVIGAGTTPYALVQRAIAEIGTECVVGVVLNRVDDENSPASGYYADYSVSSEAKV